MTLTLRPSFDMTLEHMELLKKAVNYEAASLSTNTLRSYKSMCKKFQKWCELNNQSFLPTSAETIALYLSSMGESVSFSTLDSTLAAIEASHEKEGYTISGDHTLYRRVRKGIRRTHKENQSLKQAAPVTVLKLQEICSKLGDSLKDCRDKALLTVAFFGAFRRSELVSLNLKDIEFNEKGAVIKLLQSKTSDTAELIYLGYAKKEIDVCPINALKTWIEKAQIKEGAVFLSFMKGFRLSGRLSGHSVSEIIKTHFGEEFSGHSPRRGLLTDAADKNVPLHILKKLGRHRSSEMTLRYAEAAKGFDDSAISVLGL